MRTKQHLIIYFGISFAILLFTTLIRYNSIKSDLWITPYIYLVAITLTLRLSKAQPTRILLSYLSGFLLPYLILVIFEHFYLPFALVAISYVLALLGGFLINKASKIYIKGLILLALLIYSYVSYNYLFENFQNYGAYGSFDGRTDIKLPIKCGFVTEENDTIILSEVSHNRIILIDIWSTKCGNCFIQFPILQKMYDYYKTNPLVEITAMNVPSEYDSSGQAITMVRMRNYSFPISIPFNSFDTAMQVYAYPVTIIVNNNKVVYKGPLKFSKSMIDDLLKNK